MINKHILSIFYAQTDGVMGKNMMTWSLHSSQHSCQGDALICNFIDGR